MIHCSLPQALSVWADLEDAYNGRHNYGGDTAEIYAYRLVGHKPSAAVPCGTFGEEAVREMAEQASAAMSDLLTCFMARRPCKITIEPDREGRGKRFKAGGKLAPQPHRFHILIEPRRV